MIKVGVYYSTSLNEKFRIFEMETPSFYRLDICDMSAVEAFIVSNPIIFSIVKKRKEFTIGEASVYKEYMKCKNGAVSLKEEMQTIRKFEEGKFYAYQLRKHDEDNYSSFRTVNGRIDQEIYFYKGEQIVLQVAQTTDTTEILPFNMNRYTSQDMVKKDELMVAQDYIPYDTLRTMYPLEHIEERDYEVILDDKEIDELKSRILRRERVIGYDTEADTLIWHMYSESNLTGFILSAGKEHSRYIPIGHIGSPNAPLSLFFEFMLWCNENNVELAAHNKKFEKKIWLYYQRKIFLETGNWIPDLKILHDSLIASVLNNPVVIKGIHGLKNLRELLEGKFYLELNQVFPGTIMFPALDMKTTKLYACPDADGTVDVLESELSKMKHQHAGMLSLYALECELADLKAEQEFYGMRVDEDATLASSKLVEENRELMRKLIHKMMGEEADIDKPAVITNLLYNTLKCQVLVRTKTGKPSTGAASLKKLSRIKRDVASVTVTEDVKNSKKDILVTAKVLNGSKYPILHLLQEYRGFNKQITGFYERIKKNKVASRLFFSINQNGTETGRQSSSIHQMSKKIRHVLQSDSDDHDFVAADYCQMELRLFFSWAGEDSLVTMCYGDDVDIHRAIAAEIQGKEMWDISAEERQEDKARNFGVIYMMSGRGLASAKYGVGATTEQIKECEESIDTFYNKFKRCAKFIRQNAIDAETNLFSETLFGRIRRFDELADSSLSSERRARLLRRANNMPVQGTGADVTKLAEVMINREIKKRGWDKLVLTPQGYFPLVRVMVSVHDEVLLSKHKSIPTEELLDVLTNCMEIQLERKGKAWAPLYIGTKIGKNWGDGKRDELDIPRSLRLKLIEDYKRTGKSAIKGTDTMEEMHALINNYRETELASYMESLIMTAGEDVEEIWKILRHPSLTHELIARFPQSSEHEKLHPDLSHHDKMRYAIEQYLEFRKTGAYHVEPAVDAPTSKKQEDHDIEEYYRELTGLNEEISYIDEEGNLYFEDEESASDYADEGILSEDDIYEVHKRTGQTISNIVEFFDAIYVDTDCLYEEEVNELIKMLWTNRAKDGFYSVYLARFGDVIDTRFKIEEFSNKEQVADFLRKKREERGNQIRTYGSN